MFGFFLAISVSFIGILFVRWVSLSAMDELFNRAMKEAYVPEISRQFLYDTEPLLSMISSRNE